MKKALILASVLSVIVTNKTYALNCSNPKIGYEINVCFGEEEQKADKELNQVYQQFLKADSRHKKQLIQSELAWIKFRDLECKFQSLSFEGGTLENQEYSRTFIRLTKERIQHLKNAISKIG